MNNENNQNNFQQPMTDPNAQMMQQQPMTDQNAQMMQQQPMMNPNAQMMQQQPMMNPNAQMMQQQTMPNPNGQIVQQPPQNQAQPPQDNQEEKKPEKKTPIFVLILVILLLGVGCYFGYQIFFNNKTVVQAEVSTLLKATSTGLDAFLNNTTNIDSSKNIVGFSGTLTMDSNYAEEGIDLTKLKNYKIEYNGASDSKTNSSSFHGAISNASGPFIDVKMLTKEDSAYISLGDIFGKVLKVDADTSVVNANVDRSAQIKATKKLIEKTEPILKEYIDENKIETETVKKKIQEDEKKYNKISYKFDVDETKKYLAKQYLNDDEIIECLTVLLEKSKDGVKKELQDIVSSDITTGEIIAVDAYKRPFITRAEEIDVVSYYKSSPDSKSIIEFKFSTDVIDFKILSNETELYNGKVSGREFSIRDVKGTVEANITFDDNEIRGHYGLRTGDSTVTAEFSSKNEKSKVTSTLALSIDGRNISFKNEMNVTEKGVVEELDTSNAVTLEQITPEEQQYLYNQLQQKISIITNDLVTAQYRMTNDFTNITNIFTK